MNRRHWTRYLLIVSLSLNLGIVGALLLQPSKHQPTGNPASQAHLNLQDHLELNTEQRARWQALEPDFLRELAANWQAIRQHREALVRHIFAATPDRAAIDAEQAAIARLQGAQQQRVITQLLAERALLDERQRTRLMELLLNRYAQETTEEEQLHRD